MKSSIDFHIDMARISRPAVSFVYEMVNDIPELIDREAEGLCYDLVWDRQKAADRLFNA